MYKAYQFSFNIEKYFFLKTTRYQIYRVIAQAAQLIHVLHVVAGHFQNSDYFNTFSCKRGIHTIFFFASRLGKRLYKSKLFWICFGEFRFSSNYGSI